MNWKTTLVLMVVVAGLGAWVYFGESAIDPTAKTTSELVAKGFKVDDVTRVEIARGKDQAELVVCSKGPDG